MGMLSWIDINMGMLSWLFSKQMIQEKQYNVVLYHDQGHDITLEEMTEKNLKFIRNNLGKDIIYMQGNTFVNLNKFSIGVISLKK